MDEIHFAPPKKPWNGLIPCTYQQTVVSHGFFGGAGFRPSKVCVTCRVGLGFGRFACAWVRLEGGRFYGCNANQEVFHHACFLVRASYWTPFCDSEARAELRRGRWVEMPGIEAVS